MLANKLMGSAGEDTLYVDDVFTSYLRTGTGADTTVTTNIDMTKGYMLWTKGRSGATDHAIYDSARGVTFDLASNTTAAQTTQSTGLKAVSATGHTVGSLAKMNTSGATYVDFVFRKAPKFFDVVTYTGNGDSARDISHSLGTRAGMVLVKKTSGTSDWKVNVFIGWDYVTLALNSTNTRDQNLIGGYITSSTPSIFQVSSYSGSVDQVNALGATYVAYLFAHDPSADGIIQCGSFTTDASGKATVNLGWEPQYVMVKKSADTGDWFVFDSMRGMENWLGGGRFLSPNLPNSEVGSGVCQAQSMGFMLHSSYIPGSNQSQPYIYLAIRRPNKPPTSGTEVYAGLTQVGTGVQTSLSCGFAPDMLLSGQRFNAGGTYRSVVDRLRGVNVSGAGTGLLTQFTQTEAGSYANEFVSFDMNGVTVGTGPNQIGNSSGLFTMLYHFFKRAKGFFDIVCYTGTGVARTVNHSLGVAPELMIVKRRSFEQNWAVYSADQGASKACWLDTGGAFFSDSGNAWNNTAPTSSVFTVKSYSAVNGISSTYVAYLFASLANVSKCFSYTGNGTSLNVECGFSTGARFVLCKRVDSAGDWFVFDSVRGITASNDPRLSLNTTAAEVTTDDSIDPYVNGFTVNQNAATNLNVNGGTYIGLAIA